MDPSNRTQITLFGIIWCLICGILIIIGSLLVLALIPLYLSNHSVEVARSNETLTDIWAIEYYTDYPYASTRAIIQANKQALSQSTDQTYGLKPGTTIAVGCSFYSNKRRRRQDTALEIGAPSTALYILYAQFRYPSSCSDVDGCKKLFQKRLESTIEEPKTLSMEVPLIDGQIIRFHGRERSLTENYNEGGYESDVNSPGND